MTKGFLKGLLLTGLGLVLLTTPAAAQIKWHLGVGASLPQSDLADEDVGGNAATGFGVHGGATFGLGSGPVSIKADASWESWGINDSDESWSMIGVTADAVLGFGKGSAKPYILGGVGFNSLGVSVDGIDDASGVQFNVGGGVNFMLGSMNAFVEARYNMTSLEFSGSDFDMNSIPIVVGVRF